MISESHGGELDFGIDIVMDEKAGITWFLIDDNIEIFRIYCAHWEFPWMVEGCVVDRNG